MTTKLEQLENIKSNMQATWNLLLRLKRDADQLRTDMTEDDLPQCDDPLCDIDITERIRQSLLVIINNAISRTKNEDTKMYLNSLINGLDDYIQDNVVPLVDELYSVDNVDTGLGIIYSYIDTLKELLSVDAFAYVDVFGIGYGGVNKASIIDIELFSLTTTLSEQFRSFFNNKTFNINAERTFIELPFERYLDNDVDVADAECEVSLDNVTVNSANSDDNYYLRCYVTLAEFVNDKD